MIFKAAIFRKSDYKSSNYRCIKNSSDLILMNFLFMKMKNKQLQSMSFVGTDFEENSKIVLADFFS